MELAEQKDHVNQGVYVLRLKEDKYYVGCSSNIERRLENHNTSWTSKYKPVEVVDKIPAEDEDMKDLEREVTLRYMKVYGWRNVRGAGWTRSDLKNKPNPIKAS